MFQSSPSTATITIGAAGCRTAYDPWDAPYFGGHVYLSYQPDIYAAALGAIASAPAHLANGTATQVPAGVAPIPAQGDITPANGATPAFDPWDAPYFGAPVYFGYSTAPTTPLAQPAQPAGPQRATMTASEPAPPDARWPMRAAQSPSRWSRFLKWLRS